MARFTSDGIDDLGLSLTQMMELPDSVQDNMLKKGGEIVASHHRAALSSLGLIKSGKLKGSIEVHMKRGYALIYPTGSHHKYGGKTYQRSWSKGGRKKRKFTVGSGTVTNNDVGFIHEFGAPGRNIPAQQWMRTANELSATETVAEMAEVYNEWLDDLGL